MRRPKCGAVSSRVFPTALRVLLRKNKSRPCRNLGESAAYFGWLADISLDTSKRIGHNMRMENTEQSETSNAGLWRPKDVARYLGISVSAVYNLIAEGSIPCEKYSARVYRFDPAAVIEWRKTQRFDPKGETQT